MPSAQPILTRTAKCTMAAWLPGHRGEAPEDCSTQFAARVRPADQQWRQAGSGKG